MSTFVTFAQFGKIKENIDIRTAIGRGKDYQYQINDIRQIDKATNYKKYKDLKDKMPVYTPSCVCEGETLKFKNITHINNVIAIDIDADDNPTLSVDKMKEIVTKLPYVRYCAKSVGGKGIYCLVPFKKEYANKDNFKEVFLSLQKDFAEMGIVIDKQCWNINRPRYVSYDDMEYI